MDSAFTFKVSTGANSTGTKHEGDAYTVEQNGGLVVRRNDGTVVAHYAPGHWGSITSEPMEKTKTDNEASAKALRDARGLTDDQREVQDMQERAQFGNPYANKPDLNALTNADNEGVDGNEPDTNSNPPKAGRTRKGA